MHKKIERKSVSFKRTEQTSGKNINVSCCNEVIYFGSECSIPFNGDAELDCPLFEGKEFQNGYEHLHDTIPHEDELEEFEELKNKGRKNLRAKKRKKSKYEVQLLEEYFEKDPEWSRQTVKQLKPLLNLTVDQIYKWGYDRKQLIEKRKTSVTRKKRVRKAKTMQTSEIKGNVDAIQENSNQTEENEGNVILDCTFDQIACNLIPVESNKLYSNQVLLINQEYNDTDCQGKLREEINSKIHHDSKIDKIFFENSSEAIDLSSSLDIKQIFNQEESDLFIGDRY